MHNPAIEPVAMLESLVARRVCTSVIATGPDGVPHLVPDRDIATSEFPRGTVHHFGPVAFLEDDVVISQYDEAASTILLIHADGTATTIAIVAQDAIALV